MIARHNFARCAGLAVVKQNEVLDQIQQTPVVQHALQEHLRLQAAFIAFVEPLELGEVFPLAGDGAVARVVPVTDDQE